MSYYADTELVNKASKTERMRIRHSAFHLWVFCVFIASGSRPHVKFDRHSASAPKTDDLDIIDTKSITFSSNSDVLNRDRGGIFYNGHTKVSSHF